MTYNRGGRSRCTALRLICSLGSGVAVAALPFLLHPAQAVATAGVVAPAVATIVPGKSAHVLPTIRGKPAHLLPAAEAYKKLTPGQLHVRAPSTRLTLDAKRLRAAKRAVAGAATTAAPALPAGPPVSLVNQPGLQATDEGGCCTPPDTTGAIGPNHYVETVNSLVGVYDRSLAQVASLDLALFVGVPGATVFDPQILFDARGGRWYYVTDVGTSALALGWSKTDDPSDLLNGWCQFISFNTDPVFHDFPKLGGDDNFVTIGTNGFVGGTFVSSFIWATVKPLSGDTSCTVPNGFLFGDPASPLRNADGTIAFTPVPANTTDANATGYIVSAHLDSLPANKVMAWHLVRQADGSAALLANGDMIVNSYNISADAPQPGVSFLISTSDTRITQAAGRTDPDAGAQAVWAQHTVAGPGGRSVVRWYEFLPGSLIVRQQGEIQNATAFVFNGAISPSSTGNDAAIFYNRSSSSTLPLIGAQSRTSATPIGTMDPGELLLGNSVDPLQETGFGSNCIASSCRWGDYAGATPDPVTPGVVWGTGELSGAFNGGLGQWLTRNYAVTT